MKCFYHAADLDGRCSRAIIKHAHPDCKMIGINYGDEFPWESISTGVWEVVYMVDFCLQPFEDMERLSHMCNLAWIDHHKSAIEEVHKRWFTAYEQSLGIGIGACALVWDHCHPGEARPKAVQLLAEYDVRDHHNPWTLPFQYGMRVENTDPSSSIWGFMLRPGSEDVMNIVDAGHTVLRYVKRENRKYMDACGFETSLDGLRAIAINRMLTNSQMFDNVWDPVKYDVMLTFGFRAGQWTVSLYTDKDAVDVSVIAKAHGGGGHKGAAGFQCRELPFALPWALDARAC